MRPNIYQLTVAVLPVAVSCTGAPMQFSASCNAPPTAHCLLSCRTAIIGRLGTAPLGAVGLSTLIFVFSNLFFNFLTVCTTSSVANAAAEKNTAEVRCLTRSILL